MNISCIRVLSKLLSRSRQLYYLHIFYPRTVIRKVQDYHLSYVNQHPTDYKYKYNIVFNHLVLCALFCRSQIWLLHSHPTSPVNTAQVAYLSTHLVSKVCGFDDITKQAYFNNPGQQLDFYQKLITYQFRFIRECLNRTSRGFFKAASGNGASMMKFPLSVTTGPAFARAMRRVAFGESSFVCRLRRTGVCANGETSMGTPETYLGYMGNVRESRNRKTYTGSQDGRVLPVVRHDDESAEDWHWTHTEKTDRLTSWLLRRVPFRATGRRHHP